MKSRSSWLVIVALIAGLLLGALAGSGGGGWREPAVEAASTIGGLWLDALKMTVVPLIVALLVTGIVAGAEHARAGGTARRAIIWFVSILTGSAIIGALMTPLLVSLFPLPETAAAALRAGLASVDSSATETPVPGAGELLRSFVPDNVVSAAAEGRTLALVVFSLLFAFAIASLPAGKRRLLGSFFDAVGDALLVIIGWVLWLAPIGVFALGFSVGAGAGAAALGAVAHYMAIVSAVGLVVIIVGYAIALAVARWSPGEFQRAMFAPQAVAISTQSSLASLPAMLVSAEALRVSERVRAIVLPMSVALFRATGPAMNMAVAVYIAHWLGIEPTLPQMLAATAVAAVMSYGSASLPGQISFITSIAPICLALGVPITPLALLVAVENIPDIVRTLGNVTLDVAVTGAVARGEKEIAETAPHGEAAIPVVASTGAPPTMAGSSTGPPAI
ncbi:MAG TPA: cation:dicarboxylase symporter family transporter [Sphingomicrobium sp.]|nr:cation:dicarboxylase symporter family transporter [Sphingomicrobium sp.]